MTKIPAGGKPSEQVTPGTLQPRHISEREVKTKSLKKNRQGSKKKKRLQERKCKTRSSGPNPDSCRGGGPKGLYVDQKVQKNSPNLKEKMKEPPGLNLRGTTGVSSFTRKKDACKGGFKKKKEQKL